MFDLPTSLCTSLRMTSAHAWVTVTCRLQFFSNSKQPLASVGAGGQTRLPFNPCCSGMGLWYATEECMCVWCLRFGWPGRSRAVMWLTLSPIHQIKNARLQQNLTVCASHWCLAKVPTLRCTQALSAKREEMENLTLFQRWSVHAYSKTVSHTASLVVIPFKCSE